MGRRPCLMVCLALLPLFVSGQEAGLSWLPAPGTYTSARVSLALPPGAFAEYRFVGEGDGFWRPLTDALELSAFPREERTYVIQARVADGRGVLESEARYVIDRLPPSAPAFSPPSGSYEGPLDLRLSAEEGATILYSLAASDRPSSGFLVYDEAVSVPRIDRPRDGTRGWALIAYAVDSSGNPGPVVTARYEIEPNPRGASSLGDRKEPPGPQSAFPPAVAEGGALEPRIERRAPGKVRVLFRSSDTRRVFAAVNPRVPSDIGVYTELPLVSGEASMELTAPMGWTGPLKVRYAVLEDGQFRLAPEPVEVAFSYEDPRERPPPPPEPEIIVSPGTNSALVSWPPFPFTVEWAVGDGSFTPYAGPVSVTTAGDGTEKAIRYRSRGEGGAVSEERLLRLAPEARVGIPEIAGFPEGGLTNRAVKPRVPAGSIVRYEVSTEGLPLRVTTASALLDDSTAFEGEDGKETRYTVRLRAFGDSSGQAEGSDERFASFVVDRLSPPVPTLLPESLSEDSEADRRIAFQPQDGTIRFAVAERGTAGDPVFSDYEGPVTLAGNGDRAVSYEVYAYAVDAAGNRSGTVVPISVRIDRASVYVAAWGNDGNAGGSRNPLGSLAAGVEEAVRAGKRFVRVQGDVPIGGTLRPKAALEILGGCDESWEPAADRRSRIDVGGYAGPVFNVNGTEFVLRNLDLEAAGGKEIVIAEVTEGLFKAYGLSTHISTAGEAAFIRARESRVELHDCSLILAECLFARGVAAQGGQTLVRDFSLDAREGIGYLTGFSFEGGVASISGLRSETRTGNGFTLLRSVRAQTDFRDSYAKEEGSGYCEAFHFEGGEAALYQSSFDLSCDGKLTFVSLEGSAGDVLYATVALSSRQAVFLAMKEAQARVGNTIAMNRRGEGVFLSTDAVPRRGTVVRNALSGFRLFIEGPAPAATVDALNLIAAPPDGPNFVEPFGMSELKTLRGLPALSPSSQGVNGAYPLDIPEPPLGSQDIQATRRDVGALEVSR